MLDKNTYNAIPKDRGLYVVEVKIQYRKEGKENSILIRDPLIEVLAGSNELIIGYYIDFKELKKEEEEKVRDIFKMYDLQNHSSWLYERETNTPILILQDKIFVQKRFSEVPESVVLPTPDRVIDVIAEAVFMRR